MLDFSLIVIFSSAIIILLAAIIRGFTGFGFSAICVASLTLLIPPLKIVPIILGLEILASLFMFSKCWKYIEWKNIFKIFIGTIVGTPLGSLLLIHLPSNTTRSIIYILIATLCLCSLLLEKSAFKSKISFPAILIGFLAGIANGLAAILGIVVAIFMLLSTKKHFTIRANLIALVFFSDIYALIWQSSLKELETSQLFLLLIFLPALLLGVFLGQKLFNKASTKNYKLLIYILLISISIFGLLQNTILTKIY